MRKNEAHTVLKHVIPSVTCSLCFLDPFPLLKLFGWREYSLFFISLSVLLAFYSKAYSPYLYLNVLSMFFS